MVGPQSMPQEDVVPQPQWVDLLEPFDRGLRERLMTLTEGLPCGLRSPCTVAQIDPPTTPTRHERAGLVAQGVVAGCPFVAAEARLAAELGMAYQPVLVVGMSPPAEAGGGLATSEGPGFLAPSGDLGTTPDALERRMNQANLLAQRLREESLLLTALLRTVARDL